MLTTCIVCSGEQKRIFTYGNFQYVRCRYCGTVATVPIPSFEEINDHYHRKFLSGNYNLLLTYSLPYQKVYLKFAETVEQVLQAGGESLAGKKVLDIGCFTGELLKMFDQKGAEVYGLELQEEAVKLANQALPGRVFQADLQEDKFSPEFFDVITFTGLIEHVVDPVALLDRIYTLLKPGGVILLQTPNSGSLMAKAMGKYWPPYAPIEHIFLFSQKSIKLALKNAGFAKMSLTWHWKTLPISYVFENFKNFGPEWQKLLMPIYNVLPNKFKEWSIPFYGGEMIVTAQKINPNL